MITSPIRTFMKFTLDSKRKKLWKKFSTRWKKVFMVMDSAPGNEFVSGFVRNEWVRITEANIQSSFDIVLQYIITQAECMFPMKYSTWSVTTWCKKMNYYSIINKGYYNDEALLKSSNTR